MPNIPGTNLSDVLIGTALADEILGLGGNDTIFGNQGNDLIYGGDGNDFALGGSGNDTMDGGEGDDSMRGEDGHDQFRGGAGKDTLLGGNGDDWIDGGADADWMQGDAGNDTADYITSGGGVWVTLNMGVGFYNDAHGDQLFNIENLRGSHFGDWLQGDAGANKIEGLSGGDVLEGLGGNDTILGGEGGDRILGGAGHDDIYGETGDDKLFGEEGDDWLAPGLGNATVDGGEGIDTLDLRVFDDFTGWKIDLADGTGERPKASLIGKNGTKQAEIPADSIETESVFLSEFLGETGLWPFPNDMAEVEADTGLWPFPDEPVEDAGLWPFPSEEMLETFGADPEMAFSDTGLPLDPWFEDKPELFEPDLGTGPFKPVDYTWNMTIEGIENIIGSHGDDVLRANDLANEIYGGLGNDVIEGRGGDDMLIDQWGDNTMDGGDGSDWLIAPGGDLKTEMTGGADADHFVFIRLDHYSPALGSRGEITDFEQGDTIYLEDTTVPGPLDFIGAAAFDGTAPQARVTQTGASALVEVDRVGDGQADWWIEVALQDATYTLSDTDFVMI